MMKNIAKRMAAAAIVAAMAVTVATATNANAASQYDLTGTMNQDIQIHTTKKCEGYTVLYVAPDNGYSSIDVKNVLSGEGSYIKLTDENDVVIYDSDKNIHKISDFAVTKGMKYYLYVQNNNRYGFFDSECSYDVNWTFTPSDLWETEPNDTSDKADQMTEGKIYTGTRDGYTETVRDVDMFTFTLGKDREVTINFGPQIISQNGDWKLTLINENGEESELGYGISSKQTYVKNLKKGTYYLSVGGGDANTIKYNLSYKTTAISSLVTPKISSFQGYRYKSYSGRSNIHMDEIDMSKSGKNVTGYRLKVAKNKKMKGILYDKTIDVEYPDRINNLDTDIDYKGKKVYVTVQPYVKDPFGHEIWGKKSKVKAVKLSLKK